MVVVSNSPEWVRLVNKTVICRFLKKSTRRMSTDFTSLWLATMDRLVMGSMITVAGQSSFAPLSGDQRGDALVLQPTEEPAQLGAQDQLVGEPREQGLHRVQHHPFGSHGVDGVPQADEEALQIVLTGLLDFATLDINEFQGEELLFFQVRQVETREATFLASSSEVSSKDKKTPGSP